MHGGIDTVGSDHCCFHGDDKVRSGHDVRAMPYGMPGVESRLPVLFSEFVVARGMSVERFVDFTSTTPARLNGLGHRKGAVEVGADADVVVWDQSKVSAIEVQLMHMGMDYDPYEGRTVQGWPQVVIAGGKIVVESGVFTDPGPVGDRLKASPVFPLAVL